MDRQIPIKMLTSYETENICYKEGDIVKVTDLLAAQLIAEGKAELPNSLTDNE